MNSSPPLISIALCTYNGEKFIIEQLESLLNQSYPNLEIVVVDDKSTDNTFNILKNFQEEGKIKLFQNSQNLGFLRNFEKCISLCKGDLIALSDQDDIWHPEKISKLATHIGDSILIYADSELTDINGKSLGKKLSNRRNMYSGNDCRAFVYNNSISGHSILFKKELTKFFLPFPANSYHDWWIAYVASSIGKISFLNECLVKYRQHEGANTDILKIKRLDQNTKRKSKTERETIYINNHLQWLEILLSFPYISSENKLFFNELHHLYSKKLRSYYNFSLFSFLLTYRKVLFNITRKPLKSKLFFIYKEGIGIKLQKFYSR